MTTVIPALCQERVAQHAKQIKLDFYVTIYNHFFGSGRSLGRGEPIKMHSCTLARGIERGVTGHTHARAKYYVTLGKCNTWRGVSNLTPAEGMTWIIFEVFSLLSWALIALYARIHIQSNSISPARWRRERVVLIISRCWWNGDESEKKKREWLGRFIRRCSKANLEKRVPISETLLEICNVPRAQDEPVACHRLRTTLSLTPNRFKIH